MPSCSAGPLNPVKWRYRVPVVLTLIGNHCPVVIATVPNAQNHNTSQWIDRQINKLLPVRYFMITFTLPFQFRALARRLPKQIYSLFFLCVKGVLNDFGLNPKQFGGLKSG